MTKTPEITVLMPVHNPGRYLKPAIASILGQSFRDFELVVIDDGSCDGSSAALTNYVRLDSRIRVVRQEKSGIVVALNHGLSLARGKYLARMDGDDVSHLTRLERQVDYLRMHPECIVLGTAALAVDTEGDPIAVIQVPANHEGIEGELLRGNSTALIHPTVCMVTDAVRSLGGYRAFASEDLDLFLRLCLIGHASNLPEPLLDYRQHLQSVTTTVAFEERRRHREMVLQEAYQHRSLDASKLMVSVAQRPISAFEYHVSTARRASRQGFSATARKHAFKALLNSPSALAGWRILIRVMVESLKGKRTETTRSTMVCQS
jgi:glycosyltransferase involved in cell wall biosynthesis